MQTTIDFDRSAQQGALRRLAKQLPKPPAEWQTSAATMTTVLRDLDYMTGKKDGFRVSHRAIGERNNISASAVKRALCGLVALDLVAVNRTGRASVYSINWPAVEAQAEQPQATPARDGHRSGSAPSESALCPIRESTLPHQIGHSALSTLHPPPTNTPTATLTDFTAAAELLKEAGLELTAPTIDAAKAAGLEPVDLVDLVETYQANRDRLESPGAIRFRIRNGAWPVAGVRTPAEANAAAASRARRQIWRREQLGDQARAEKAAADRLADLEARHGDTLDALGPDQLDDLAARTFSPFHLRHWRAGRLADDLRGILLEALEGRH